MSPSTLLAKTGNQSESLAWTLSAQEQTSLCVLRGPVHVLDMQQRMSHFGVLQQVNLEYLVSIMSHSFFLALQPLTSSPI